MNTEQNNIELTKVMHFDNLPTLEAKQTANKEFGAFYDNSDFDAKKKLALLEQSWFDKDGHMRFAVFNDATVMKW